MSMRLYFIDKQTVQVSEQSVQMPKLQADLELHYPHMVYNEYCLWQDYGYLMYHMTDITRKSMGTSGQCSSRAVHSSAKSDQELYRLPKKIWELHCPLMCRIGFHWLTSRQCSSRVRLRNCADWSGASVTNIARGNKRDNKKDHLYL